MPPKDSHQILKLSVLNAPLYASLTYPGLRPTLWRLPPFGNYMAIGACHDRAPVGLLLAYIDSGAAAGTVASVFVLEEYRRRGIAAALLARGEEELRQSGCRSVDIQYTAGRPEIAFLEGLLARRGWLPPETTMLSCKATSAVLEAPFFRAYRLPPGFEVFLWKDLSAADRKLMVQSHAARPWIPRELNPFVSEVDCEPLTSVGLRQDRDVVGWMITHNRLPMSIRYTCGYVREELKRSGLFIPLLESAIRRQLLHFPNTPGTWTVLLRHEAMIRFVRKRMSPYVVSVREVRRSSKILD
jgi:GNAT superfamily N-acetyltransferase